MLALRTPTRAAARLSLPRQIRSTRIPTRRLASTHTNPHHDPPPGPTEETFSKGFYISLAAIFTTLAIFKAEHATAGTDLSPITRAINYYSDVSDLWAVRNHRHVALVEQAGRDRSLFQDSKGSGVIPVKAMETFNFGSPYNNQAGWAGGNMTEIKNRLEARL